MADTYDDGKIVCGPDGLEIHAYYFPSGTKRAPYTQIKRLQRIEINGLMSGRWRIWGSGNPRYWANLDVRRPRKKAGFIVDLGRMVSPLITPDDPDAFERALRERANLPAESGAPMPGPYI